jgi:hypothetical protein
MEDLQAVSTAPAGAESLSAQPFSDAGSEVPSAASQDRNVTSPDGSAPVDEFGDLAQQLDDDPRKTAFLDRLRDLAGKRDEFKTQLSQLEPLAEWLSPIERLAAAGLTPDALLPVLLGGPAGGETPLSVEEQYAEFLARNGVDTPGDMDPQLEGYWRREFQNEQRWQAMEAREQAAQEAEFRASWRGELQSLQGELPRFQNPLLRDALLNLYEERYGDQPNAGLLRTLAQELDGVLQSELRGELARYQAGKQGDAVVPTVSGGSAPPPAEVLNYHHLPESRQRELIRSFWQTASTPV